MPPLVLHIRINQDNELEVIEAGTSCANKHSQSCNEIVRWESVEPRIQDWTVQFVDQNGDPLPEADSPFQHQKTKFSASGSHHDQGQIKACEGAGGSEHKYTVSCTVTGGQQPPLLDPILVVSDPGGLSEQTIARLRKIEQQLEALSRGLNDVAEQVRALAEDLQT